MSLVLESLASGQIKIHTVPNCSDIHTADDGEDNNVHRVGDDDGDGDDDIGGDGPLSQMGKCVEAWVFVHVPAVQLFNWTWHGTRNKQQHFAFVLYFAVFCLKKVFSVFQHMQMLAGMSDCQTDSEEGAKL